MTTLQQTRPAMKTRDKIKYCFAGLLAVMTVVAIGGLFYARHQRHQISMQEEMQVRQVISIYGENGALPEKIDPSEIEAAPGQPGL